MDVVKYDESVHSKDVVDSFSESVKEPEHFQKFKKAILEAHNDIKDVFGVNAEFDVVIAEIDTEKMEGEEFNPWVFFRGYSLGKDFHDHAEQNLVYIATTTEYEWWEAGLKNMYVHEEAHQEFMKIYGPSDHIIWESIMFEGHALKREEEVREKKDYNWRGIQNSFEGSAEEIIEELDKPREWEGEKYDRENSSSLYSYGGEEWSDAEGYIISLKAFKDIMERNEMAVDEPITKSEEWIKDEIKSSLREVYS